MTTQIELAGKARGYVTGQLAEATFQQFISIFENFVFELLRLWLIEHPESLRRKQVDLESVLNAPDKDAIKRLVIEKQVVSIMYNSPKEWFRYLESKVKLGCPTSDEIDRFAEAKATRDALVHNRGVANKIYVSKSGAQARFKENDRIDISEQYHRDTWELLRKIIADVSTATIRKARSP